MANLRFDGIDAELISSMEEYRLVKVLPSGEYLVLKRDSGTENTIMMNLGNLASRVPLRVLVKLLEGVL